MATYAELLSMIDNEALFNKIRVAVWVAADTIRAEDAGTPNHTARVAWAKNAFANPDAAARILMPAVLAQNKAAALATIQGATDAQVQAAVDAAVNTIA